MGSRASTPSHCLLSIPSAGMLKNKVEDNPYPPILPLQPPIPVLTG